MDRNVERSGLHFCFGGLFLFWFFLTALFAFCVFDGIEGFAFFTLPDHGFMLGWAKTSARLLTHKITPYDFRCSWDAEGRPYESFFSSVPGAGSPPASGKSAPHFLHFFSAGGL
jgi:hypothetical protein